MKMRAEILWLQAHRWFRLRIKYPVRYVIEAAKWKAWASICGQMPPWWRYCNPNCQHAKLFAFCERRAHFADLGLESIIYLREMMDSSFVVKPRTDGYVKRRMMWEEKKP